MAAHQGSGPEYLPYALGRRRPEITGTGNMTVQPMAAALGLVGLAPLVRIRNATPEERLKVLEDFIDRLINQDIPPIMKDIRDLKNEVGAARCLGGGGG